MVMKRRNFIKTGAAAGIALQFPEILGMYENSFPSCDGMLVGDINGDCDVNIDDLMLVVGTWLECNRIPDSLCQ